MQNASAIKAKYLLNNLASTISKLDATTQAKLGFDASINSYQIRDQINNKIHKTCQKETDGKKISCRIGALQKIANNIYSKPEQFIPNVQNKPQKSSNKWYIISAVVIIFILGIAWYYYTNGNINQLAGSRHLAFYFVIIAVLIIFAFFTRGEQKKKIKPNDWKKWQKKLKNAQKLAHIFSPTSPVLSRNPENSTSSVLSSITEANINDDLEQYYKPLLI